MLLSDLVTEIRVLRGTKSQPISKNDIEVAVKKMKGLGNGFEIIKIGSQKVVQSIPYELSIDHMAIMSLAQGNGGYVTSGLLQRDGWTGERVRVTTSQLLAEGIVWADDQHEDGERAFWFPSLIASLSCLD